MTEDKLAYTIPQACAATGLGRSKLYELISAGDLRYFKIGARTLIRRGDLEAMIEHFARAA